MRPGPVRDSLSPVGSAGPFLFLGRKHVRGERAEVTVTEGRRKGVARPAGTPSHGRTPATVLPLRAPPGLPGTPSVPFRAGWALSTPGSCLPFGSPRASGRDVSSRRRREGKFDGCYPDCLLSEPLGHVANTRASTATAPWSAPGRSPSQRARSSDNPRAAGVGAGTPRTARAGGAWVGCGSSRRLLALSGGAGGRLAPLPARSTPSRRARAPRPTHPRPA